VVVLVSSISAVRLGRVRRLLRVEVGLAEPASAGRGAGAGRRPRGDRRAELFAGTESAASRGCRPRPIRGHYRQVHEDLREFLDTTEEEGRRPRSRLTRSFRAATGVARRFTYRSRRCVPLAASRPTTPTPADRAERFSPDESAVAPNRTAAARVARSISRARSLGGECVTSSRRSSADAAVIDSTARAKASSLSPTACHAADLAHVLQRRVVNVLGSWRRLVVMEGLMFLHMPVSMPWCPRDRRNSTCRER